ncbi:PPC domain-containing protein [Anatilimnocola floriformis]|uniref:PPC domain-containing protein n=1 Tax=Anatilimnocola floriformis TaxID=2948575 RepID=UPI0020C23204|nr:PPC domain-containing protein [Anatilimnocola floriformis]
MLTYLLMLSAVGQVAAANIRPQIGYVYPPAANPGTTIEVRLGTYDWTPDMQILPHDPRVKIEITGPAGEPILTPPPYWFGNKAGQAQPPLPREVPAKITIPADVPPGEIRWQVANANGGSNIGKFVVSDLTETIEPEDRKDAIELPSIPAAVSGRISRITESDEYRFTTPTAAQITCRLEDRLGQPFSGALTIKDTTGKILADGADTAGTGVTLRFASQAGMTYTATIRDIEFAGDRGYVYRLAIRNSPEIVATLPLVVKAGDKHSLKIIGWGLDKPAVLSAAQHDVAAPAAAEETIAVDLPNGKTAAKIFSAAATDALEPGNEDPAQRQVTIPAAISATFDKMDATSGLAIDRYRFTAKKGQVLRIVAEVDRFQSPVDPQLIVSSLEGKELLRNDDAPGASDAVIQFTAPADGEFELGVSDVSGLATSLASVYRLTIDDVATLADFELQFPERLDIPLGGKADLAIKINRIGTWKVPINLQLHGLPEGVTPADVMAPAVANQIPADKPAHNLTLNAAADSAAAAALVTIIATTEVDGKKIEKKSPPILVSSTIKTRVKVKSTVQDGGRIVNRGTTYPADVIVERLDGYEGPVILQMAASQQRQRRGIRGGEMTVPAGVEQVQYPIFMPEWLETSLTARMNVIGVTPIADPKGNIRHVTGIMDGFIVMSLEGALLKLTHEQQEYVAAPGSTIDIPLKVSRTVKLPVTADLVLVTDKHSIFTADAVQLPPATNQHLLKLKIAADAKPGLHLATIRATAMQDGKWPAVSETTVAVYVENE